MTFRISIIKSTTKKISKNMTFRVGIMFFIVYLSMHLPFMPNNFLLNLALSIMILGIVDEIYKKKYHRSVFKRHNS